MSHTSTPTRLRLKQDNNRTLYFGELIIDLNRHLVTYRQKTLRMTLTEIRILYALAAGEGQAVSRRQLYDLVWTDEYQPQSNALDFHIAKIRAKLLEAHGYMRLVAVRGQGYALRQVGLKRSA